MDLFIKMLQRLDIELENAIELIRARAIMDLVELCDKE